NALARGPRFMLVALGFRLLNLGFDASPALEARLRRMLYRVALGWFALPPRWSFSGSRASVAREILMLVDARRAVQQDSAVADQDDGAGAAHVLGVPRDTLRRRALRCQALLLLLLDNEISRMATWANPTGAPASPHDHPSAPSLDLARLTRAAVMSDAGWQRLVRDAWAVDARLAVQLVPRFPHAAVRRELAVLVRRFPGELVADPDALPLLVDQLQSSAGAGAGAAPAASLGFRELKFLIYWAPVPPITSAAYLASPHVARHPLALQYAMRALESFPVDVTFFYIPQLVQALRHDALGYVQRAILSSAQISQHFAHQIIWNMLANMYTDEAAQHPDALKPALDRVVAKIVAALSGSDREYYEKEFAFFDEVTGISGKLKPFIKKSKAEKKRKIDEEMRKVRVQPGVYLPSNPEGVVVDIDYDSGRPLQSHAKAPFMATFVIRRPVAAADEVQELLKQAERTVTPLDDNNDGDSEDAQPRGASLPPPATRPGQLPVIEESHPLSAQLSIHVEHQDAASDPPQAHPLDADHLSARLQQTQIAIQRT
ncbi:phosphatidylinositol-4- kinase, partial [Coemansia sp. RSA 2703]